MDAIPEFPQEVELGEDLVLPLPNTDISEKTLCSIKGTIQQQTIIGPQTITAKFAVPRKLLKDYGLTDKIVVVQEGFEDIYHIYENRIKLELRFCPKCCTFLKPGKNNSHISKHRGSYQHTMDTAIYLPTFKRHDAMLSQLIKRFMPLDTLDDDSQADITPYLTTDYAMTRLKEIQSLMNEVIVSEIQTAHDVTLRIDGWSNRYRYEGVELEYELGDEKVVRLLNMACDLNKSHDAASLSNIIHELDTQFHFLTKLKAIGSDSAAVNIKAANIIEVEHDPCLCHKFNTVFNRFMLLLPKEISNIALAANSLHNREWLNEYFRLLKKSAIKSHSETRWLTIVNSLESYLTNYESIILWEDLRGKKDESFVTIDDPVWCGALVFALKDLKKLSQDLEKEEVEIGERTRILCRAREAIHSMGLNDVLLSTTKTDWNDVVTKYLEFFDEMFFNVADLKKHEYCIRNMAAGCYFSPEKLWYFKEQKIIDIITDFMAHKFPDINTDDIQQEKEKVPLLSISNYRYYYKNCDKFPNLYRIACYFIRFSGSNAHLERSFSIMAHIATKWRRALTPDNFRLLAFVRANQDLFKVITRRSSPELYEHITDERLYREMQNTSTRPYFSEWKYWHVHYRDVKFYEESKEMLHNPIIDDDNEKLEELRCFIGLAQKFIQIDSWCEHISNIKGRTNQIYADDDQPPRCEKETQADFGIDKTESLIIQRHKYIWRFDK